MLIEAVDYAMTKAMLFARAMDHREGPWLVTSSYIHFEQESQSRFLQVGAIGMIEKVYQFADTDDFIMEKIIDDEHVNINHTKIDIRNEGSETLEFFVVKAPNPRSMPATKKVQ